MINKQNLWFLTLFSLILVLSVYYITMPEHLLNNLNDNREEAREVVMVRESEILTALRVQDDEELLREMDALQQILLNDSKSAQEKSEAFDSLRDLNLNKGREQAIEKTIYERHELKSFVKIKNDQVRVVVVATEHDAVLANNIIRTVQESFKEQMYITVKFKN